MRYYIIAGEASGDLHASKLIRELKAIDNQADFRGFGGDLMEQEGLILVKHFRELAFMGLWDVIRNLGKINENLKFCKKDILTYQPDVLILVDYPGFNLRIAEFAKKEGVKVFYYISPKVWAWKEYRVKKIKKVVDKLFVIFPFEVDYFKKHNLEVDFVGNPLIDEIAEKKLTLTKTDFFKSNNLLDKPIIALMPGSRKNELTRILPTMLTIIDDFPEHQFVIVGTKAIDEQLYKKVIGNAKVQLLFNNNSEILQFADAGLIASGTATLETALYNLPQVVCYKTDSLTWTIGNLLVNLKYVSLVNIIMGKEVVRELLQNKMNKENIIYELKAVLKGGSKREQILKDYSELRTAFGESGTSKRLASLMYSYLTKV